MVPEAPDDIVVRRRRRPDGGPDPHPRPADARHRRHHPAPPGRGHPGPVARRHRDHRRPRHRQDRRRPAPRGLPALLRPAPVRERRHPRRRPVRGLHGVHRARAAVPRRGVGRAARARRPRRGHDGRSGSTPPRSRRSRGRCASAGCSRGSPRDRRAGAPDGLPGVHRRHRRAPRRHARSPGALRGAAHRTSTTSPTDAARSALAEAAWRSVRQGERDVFLDAFDASRDVDEFMASWWRQLDPRELLLVARRHRPRLRRLARACSTTRRAPRVAVLVPRGARDRHLVGVRRRARRRPRRPGSAPVQVAEREDVGFYDIEELDELSQWGVIDVRAGVDRRVPAEETQSVVTPADARERLMHGPHRPALRLRPRARRRGPGPLADAVADARAPGPGGILDRRRRRRAGVVVRPRRGRPRARRGVQRRRSAGRSTWTPTTATPARSSTTRATSSSRSCPTPTSRMPCARPASTPSTAWSRARSRRPRRTPSTSCSARSRARSPSSPGGAGPSGSPGWTGAGDGRVQVIDPLSTKGLEWDATVVVDPQGIVEESPGGVRVLYVVLTRAAHRMHVLRPA